MIWLWKSTAKADTAVNVSKPVRKRKTQKECLGYSFSLSRKADRPTALNYINAVFDEFIEFHSDRCFKDDGAIVGRCAMFHGMPVTVIGQQKERIPRIISAVILACHPLMVIARHCTFNEAGGNLWTRPLSVCRHTRSFLPADWRAREEVRAEAIAKNLFEMSSLKVPVLSIVINEGGSGGALAMAVANEVWMMENAIIPFYHGRFASILYKDSKSRGGSRVMKVTAADLKELGLIRRIIQRKNHE